MDVRPACAQEAHRLAGLARAHRAHRAPLHARGRRAGPCLPRLRLRTRWRCLSRRARAPRARLGRAGTRPARDRAHAGERRARIAKRGATEGASRLRIAALGAGRMGRGIGHVFAYAGYGVDIIDFKPRPLAEHARIAEAARAEIAANLGLLRELGEVADVEA